MALQPSQPTVSPATALPAERIKVACEQHWPAHKADCSGFVKAVTQALQVALAGNADSIVDHIRTDAGWHPLTDGTAAKAEADAGRLVIAGLRSEEHHPPRRNGHVVIVVSGDLAHGKYPTAYWGSLDSVGKRNTTLNFSWNRTDRDLITYAVKL